jgi:uncharacterized protein (DUF433 family)
MNTFQIIFTPASAAGAPTTEILIDYPGLVEDDILACIAYGSEMSRERHVDIPLEAHA